MVSCDRRPQMLAKQEIVDLSRVGKGGNVKGGEPVVKIHSGTPRLC